ncbi:hypothetical protein J4471_01195 [Candidatus Woesearchaeota archaeon]|nr:hypothetical protein [Candidatus Woesearchaeota archaeon]
MPIDDYFRKTEGKFLDNSFTPENYVILEGKSYANYSYPDLLVSKKRTHIGKDWIGSQRGLHMNNSFMFNLTQFVDFIKLIRSDKVYDGNGRKLRGQEVNDIENNFLAWHHCDKGEWLDTNFTPNPKGGLLIINYDHRTLKGELRPMRSDALTPYLEKDMWINFEEWLSLNTIYGLPWERKYKKGNLGYIAPLNSSNKAYSVSQFFCTNYGHLLACRVDHTNVLDTVGVHEVKIRP